MLVGLTGGIGAGKSTVAGILAELGARIVDGDRAARDVVDPQTPTGARLISRIAALLGDSVVRDDGSLDRALVADGIFSDEELLRDYNALLRPALLDEVAHRIADATAEPGVVVHEIPLLSRTSAPLPWAYDLVVTVEAAPEMRMRRLQIDRGYGADEAVRRVRAQGDEQDRIAIADFVLRTDGSIDETRRATGELWARLNA